MGLRLEGISLAGGERELQLPSPGITAVVGANNSGKSTLLRQLHAHLVAPQNLASEPVKLLSAVHLSREGTGTDLLAWFGQHADYRALPLQQGGDQFLRPGVGAIQVAAIASAWEHGAPNALDHLGQFLVRYADAQSRLGQIAGVGQRGDVAEAPSHPLHQLQDDVELRHRLDDLSQRIFRRGLTLDDLSGTMRLRVGYPSVSPPAHDESQRPYRAALANLPPLEQQGDGMKSLLGLLLPLITATYPIILVDEPEAFLHPPQAYQLGRALGELVRDAGVQLVLATHDRNLLAGLLAADAPLSVVRLTRQGDTTTAAQLPAEQLAELWTDPVLRYSNVLDGLFHQLVVLAEAEQDCRFYTAAMDAADRREPLPVPPADVLFVPANGKAGLARLAAALRAVDVPVVATPDLDILNEQGALQTLVTQLGHDWSDLQADYAVATDSFRQPRDRTRVRDVRDSVAMIFDEVVAAEPDARYGAELRERLHAALRSSESPWQALKRYGDRAFVGQAAQAADRLLTALDQRGVVTVRVGELEKFAPALGVTKGKEWLPAALAAGAHEYEAVQDHVRRLLAAGGYQ